MAPSTGCSFRNPETKRNYDRSEDLYGAVLIAITLREKQSKSFVSPSNRTTIICRLKKDHRKYLDFKKSCPEAIATNLNLIERLYSLSIYIWFQRTTKDIPQLVRGGSLDDEATALHLLSRSFTGENQDLRYFLYYLQIIKVC